MRHPRAKVSGREPVRTVRLPKTFRFTTDRVRIHRAAQTLVRESATERGWPVDYAASFAGMPEDFERPEPLPDAGHRDALLDAN
jgi:virulence-associated protein VagC